MRNVARTRKPRPAGEPVTPAVSRFLTAHLEDILASVGDGLVLLDRDASVAFVSPGAESLTGVSAAHAYGRPAARAFTSNPWVGETVARVHPGNLSRTSETGELLLPFGRRTSVQLTVTPVLDASGAAIGTVLLFRDLTAPPRSLSETADRGARVSELAAVAAGLAHEIKNPLGGIKGAAQLLAEELAGSPTGLRFTTLIKREVDRVSALLEQLLELTRPPRLRLSAVNVHRLLQEVLMLESAAATEALMVRCHFDPSLPDVWADEAQLRQVFLNVTKNALEAMNRAGKLTITTRMETDFHVRKAASERGQFLSVEIADSGPGIPAEDRERIFTPFFTTKANGTGLGLALSQRLVNQHGGLIHVESAAGCGTRVRISLPISSQRGT